jgi:alkanesulfonate monooxygenase SsuD/methylene tetrahydromethanopterin reductase-like flavin-dependent oxidoreductase (luciferase family)
VRNLPAPIQKHLPILIGGGGEQVTLKLVAKYGDANNVSGTPEQVAHKEEVLLKHCEAIGRDPGTIDRTIGSAASVSNASCDPPSRTGITAYFPEPYAALEKRL